VTKLGTFVLSASVLMLETALVRVFALAHGYHLAFMTISIALLGMGAGGTALSVLNTLPQDRRRGGGAAMPEYACLGFCVCTLVGFWISNRLSFDAYLIAWQPVQILRLALSYLALACPFLCAGLALAAVLEDAPAPGPVYAANLMGSAAGVVGAIGALPGLGGSGVVALSAALAGLGAVAFGAVRVGRADRHALKSVLRAAACVALAGAAYALAAWREIRLSPYRPLTYALQFPDAELVSSRWSAVSRVDVVRSGAIHVSPGLSLGYGDPVPRQVGLYVDGHAWSPIVSEEGPPLGKWADALPIAVAYRLRPGANALVLEPGGGLDVVVARALGAARVTAVSSNALTVKAVLDYGTRGVKGASWFVRSPRSYLPGREGTYDVIDVALNESQQAVVQGAFTLSEDYRLTVEAVIEYVEALAPDGLLVVQRWLQMPPSESVRAWATVVEALERTGEAEPGRRLVALRSWSTMVILVRKGAFDVQELDAIRAFCRERQFDLVYLSDVNAGEVNLYNVYEGAPYYRAFVQVLSPSSRAALYRGSTYDVCPTTDDRPFFYHFFRWRQVPEVWRSLGRTWQPFGGGGYLVLLVLVAIAVVASTLLILTPAWLASRTHRTHRAQMRMRGPALAYFGCLGFAYMAVEIPLIQRFVLYLDHATIAFAVVLTVLLVTSGIGSMLSLRIGARRALVGLMACLGLLVWGLPVVVRLTLGAPLVVRIAVSALCLAPLGLLMGVPFPRGLTRLRSGASNLTAWAWAVNGCASVVASIVTTLIALNWGFSVVLVVAGGMYAAAFCLYLWWSGRSEPRHEEGGAVAYGYR